MRRITKNNLCVAKSLKEDNDCAVRALANAFDWDYRRAHNIFKKEGRQNNCGTLTTTCYKVFSRYCGKTYYTKEYAKRVAKQESEWTIEEGNPKAKTITSFCRLFPKGTYVVLTSGHALAVVNGEPQDWTNSNNRHRVEAYWEV